MIAIDDAVAQALGRGTPVVALETTIITHGLPYPANVEAAQRLEQAVRAHGALPATIGVLDGRAHVGLTLEDLERLARGPAEKVQARSLAIALHQGQSGGTTVSATMELAHRCGLRVFATGGIGGVHRHAERTGDVSEDLHALARLPLVVVSSGAKAILDLPRTLEALETLGVAVVGYRTDGFPAFYHRDSGLQIPRVDTAADTAAIMHHLWKTIGSNKGLLVCNPPPATAALPAALVNRWLTEALEDAARRGVTGKAVTPHLLAFLDRASGGDTVRTNVALAESNARVAARIAVADRVLSRPGVNVRRAVPADAAAIAEAHRDAIQTIGARFYSADVVADCAAGVGPDLYVRAMTAGEAFFIATERSHEREVVLGFASHRIDAGEHRTAVYVRGSASRRGVGSALFLLAEAHARAAGARDLHVAASLAAVEFYRRSGFTGRGQAEHHLRSGRPMACVFMRKALYCDQE
jgi:pseudouridine-5'-phosphate glycosidase